MKIDKMTMKNGSHFRVAVSAPSDETVSLFKKIVHDKNSKKLYKPNRFEIESEWNDEYGYVQD